MRVAIFTDTFLPQVNGVTNTLKRMGDYFESQDIDYIFITPDQKSAGTPDYKQEKFFSYPLLVYPECRLTLPNMVRLTKKLDKFKPDIIMAMTEFSMGLAALNYAKKRQLPLVSNYSTNFTTILNSYRFQILEKALERYLVWFHNEANLTVTPSSVSQEYLKSIGIRQTALFVRGVDCAIFNSNHRSEKCRKELGIAGKLALLYVGRLSPEKDLDILSKAMVRLNEKYHDRIVLVVTGDGPMAEELKKTMPDNVVFTGYKKGTALAQIYASCDLFAFPSSFETFGNVVLEAMASGLPVVGVNQGGVRGLVNHGTTGYLANPKDNESFAAMIEKLIESDYDRFAFGENGRRLARTKSWNRVLDDLMVVFGEVTTAVHTSNQKPESAITVPLDMAALTGIPSGRLSERQGWIPESGERL